VPFHDEKIGWCANTAAQIVGPLFLKHNLFSEMQLHVHITTEMRDCFFSVDGGGVSGAQCDGKRVRRLLSSMKNQYQHYKTDVLSILMAADTHLLCVLSSCPYMQPFGLSARTTAEAAVGAAAVWASDLSLVEAEVAE
jgi:hypothetical protein